MRLKTFLAALIFVLGIAAVIGVALYTRPGQAQDYGYDYGYSARGGYGDGEPEYWSDIGNQPQMITYPSRGRRNVPVYRDREPEYWSDIQNPPQFVTYPRR